MEFLYWLENLRNPVLDQIMLIITAFGEEILFIGVAVILLWCVDKYDAYYMLCVGFVGTQINQLLKVTFKIERPWVQDSKIHPVKDAIPEATGYSFPSGHTQSAVGTFGSIARFVKINWLRIACIVLALLVAFSRMYLGVHTPLDVGVSLIVAVALVLMFYPIIKKARTNPNIMRILLGIMIAWSVAQIFIIQPIYNSNPLNNNFSHAIENAYKMLGCVVGFALIFELDLRFIKFDTKAGIVGQILKIVLGLVIVIGLKELGYFVFGLFMNDMWYRCVTYFLMVVFAGAVWPLTFKFFAKIGLKK